MYCLQIQVVDASSQEAVYLETVTTSEISEDLVAMAESLAAVVKAVSVPLDREINELNDEMGSMKQGFDW